MKNGEVPDKKWMREWCRRKKWENLQRLDGFATGAETEDAPIRYAATLKMIEHTSENDADEQRTIIVYNKPGSIPDDQIALTGESDREESKI